MGNAFFGWKETSLEHPSGVDAGEVSRFADWVEELADRGAVDGKVVDRLVRRNWDVVDIWRLR